MTLSTALRISSTTLSGFLLSISILILMSDSEFRDMERIESNPATSLNLSSIGIVIFVPHHREAPGRLLISLPDTDLHSERIRA